MPAVFGRTAALTRDEGWHLPALIVLFVAARLGAAAAGIVPTTQQPELWQFQNTAVLREDLLAGLWYLHSQPPLWNLFYGLSLKLFGDATLLYVIGTAANALSTWLIYRLTSALTGATAIAFGAAALFAILPATLLYENFPLSTSFVAAMVLFATWCATRLQGPGHRAAFIGFVLALWALTLTRATFHLALVPLACAAATLPWRGGWLRRFLPLLALSASLPFLVYAKNWIVFDTFSASSWGPMNLARMVTVDVPRDTLLETARKGDCDRIVELGAFAWTDQYRPAVQHDAWYVAAKQRLAHAAPYLRGYNSLEHLAAARRFAGAVPCMITTAPAIYLENVRRAARIFLSASHHYIFIASSGDKPSDADNVARMRTYVDMFDRTLWLPIGDRAKAQASSLLVVLVVAAWLTAWLFAPGWLSWRREEDAMRSRAFVIGSLFFAVELATCLVEVLENNRFRHEVEPLMFVFGAIIAALAVRHLRPTRRLQEKALNVM